LLLLLLLLLLLRHNAGKVFISMADKYKADAVGIAKQLTDMGYQVVATRGTASTLMSAGEARLHDQDTTAICTVHGYDMQ
jgi:AICAR transformylase/IMP cyclohydrolase PurH